jgi:rifampin ADP-ribosylating transferase
MFAALGAEPQAVRRPAFLHCEREWLGVGRCVAGWIEARQADEVDFSGCSRKNDGHDRGDEISVSNPAAASRPSDTSARRFYHGTRADLMPGNLIQPGYSSNYTERRSPWVYFSETLNAATWGAELAKGEGPGRVYLVEPTGAFMDDPNLTDKKYPGNPTKSYRSREPLRVVGEYLDWQGHSPEEIQVMKDFIVGKEPIDD